MFFRFQINFQGRSLQGELPIPKTITVPLTIGLPKRKFAHKNQPFMWVNIPVPWIWDILAGMNVDSPGWVADWSRWSKHLTNQPH